MNHEPVLLVATHNKGKIRELHQLLRDVHVKLIGLDEAGIDFEIDETGSTFHDNAVLKATGYARVTGLLTLADDSGLEVDALGGEPGVHTARYGGEGLTPVERYELLLTALAGIPEAARTARFRCVAALASPDGVLATTEGVCKGRIATKPSGAGGFGYDPVFLVDGQGVTMAELPAAQKNQISHRARAIGAILPQLRDALA